MRTIYHNWLLDELATRYGEGAIDRLISAFASCKLYVPQKPGGKLLAVMGADIAEWLCEQRPQTTLEIPSAPSVQDKRRISAMVNDIRASTEAVTVLAKRHGVSTRRVRAIRAELKAYDPHTRKRK